MKNKLLLLVLTGVFMSLKLNAQTNFEKGYVINNLNEKEEVYIKNIDWKNNPEKITIKKTEDAESSNLNITAIKAFGINNKAKFVRETVSLDRSDVNYKTLTSNIDPVFTEEQLFLKVLIEGQANLYEYAEGDLTKFFIKTEATDSVMPLISKKYFKKNTTVILENTYYKNQISKYLPCKSITAEDLQKLKYNKEKLFDIFFKYNNCNGDEVTYSISREKKDLFNLSLKAGLNVSSFSVEANNEIFNVDFNANVYPRFGVELEVILPFNNDAWAFFMEPTYQKYTNSTYTNHEDHNQDVVVDFPLINIPFGVRYYYHLNKQSKLFTNASFNFALSGDSSIKYSDGAYVENFSGHSYSIGLGYKYHDAFGVELRYELPHGVLASPIYSSKFQTVSLIFGYTLF